MKPVFQTKLPPKHKVGNCLAAVVASLLDLPIDEVPNFEVLGDTDLWKLVLGEWLAEQHQFFIEPSRELLRFYKYNDTEGWPYGFDNVPYIAYGLAANVPHVVVMAHNRLVHDPTPKGAGLDTVMEVWVLRHRIDPATNGGLAQGELLRLDQIAYSTVPQIPFYDE